MIEHALPRRARRLLTLLAAGLLQACGGGDGGDGGTGPGSGGTGTLLTSGVAVTGRSGSEGTRATYRVEVPAGATRLTVTTSGGTGDVDLTVRHGAPPTLQDYDCESAGGTNDELCVLEAPAAGTWYIVLDAFETYSGATLTATVTGGSGTGSGTPGATLALDPASVSLTRGGTATVTATATRTGSFTGPVTLTVTGLPAGVTASAATIASGQASATITLTASAAATLGSTTPIVRGTGTGITATQATFGLTVSAAGPVTFPAAVPTTLSSYGEAGHACGLTGTMIYCWGVGTSESGGGWLGNGTHNMRTTPTAVSGAQSWRSVAVGYRHTCALTTAGAAYCWGLNSVAGQLGTGGTTGGTTPMAVAGGVIFASLAPTMSRTNSCGLDAEGRAYCWGLNTSGQVGDGTTTNRLQPTAVSGGLRFERLAMGRDFACGLTSTGAAWCWGSGVYGQLGNMTTSFSNVPVAVLGGHQFVSISAGQTYACGLTTSGQAYCWGNDQIGRAGETRVPYAVGGALRFSQLTVGWEHTCGVTTAGAAQCYRSNYYGQLGNGTTSTTTVTDFVPVSGGLAFRGVVTGDKFTCGRTTGGEVYCWGLGTAGQLGSGSATSSTAPVRTLLP